ncbi:MAG: hypothetical protein GEV28_38760 [Actinophytocola sp.]|uniref:polysaccharide deacetylase family protein n=1 Tax=Actinophytocola sp. TaxID=1872138 RepID=UPI001326336B|nr:polysaccharide deacetylase family protein [Actinophytocola sp.]MPZ85999.1 hypothetical protein [Actinophytocola sp.]
MTGSRDLSGVVMLDRRHLAAAVLLLLVGATVVVATDREEPGRPQGVGRTGARPATVIYKVETHDPVVFLTDDGAVRDPAMIDVLRDNKFPPTMFLTRTDADPAFFRRLRDETRGAIENDTATHPNLLGRGRGRHDGLRPALLTDYLG